MINWFWLILINDAFTNAKNNSQTFSDLFSYNHKYTIDIDFPINTSNIVHIRFPPINSLFMFVLCFVLANFPITNMWLIAVIIGLIWIDCCNGSSIDRELPCDFLDSVNITDGAMQSDRSIIFDNTKFTANQYSLIDYIIANGTHRLPAEPHLRGCLCNRKPCIRLCCPYGTVHQRVPNVGIICRKLDTPIEFESEINAENSKVKTLLENHHFEYITHRPCESFYMVDNYTMTEVKTQI